jgi:hypothetical protein
VAQFKYTVVILAQKVQNLTRLPFDPAKFQSEFSVTDEEMTTLLATPYDNIVTETP